MSTGSKKPDSLERSELKAVITESSQAKLIDCAVYTTTIPPKYWAIFELEDGGIIHFKGMPIHTKNLKAFNQFMKTLLDNNITNVGVTFGTDETILIGIKKNKRQKS